MLNQAEALDRCNALVKHARSLGADAADAVFVGSQSENVNVRLGNLEAVDRSESEHFGLRVFIGQRSATIGSSAIDSASLDELASRACAMAAIAPEDSSAGLAPEDMLMRGELPDLDLVSDPTPTEMLRETALAIEDAARAVGGITNSEGAGAGTGRSTIALVTSHGFAGAYRQSQHSRSAAVVAGTGNKMERGSEWRVARHSRLLPDGAAVGRRAAERAVARLNPESMRSGPMPVVFDPLVGRSLIGHLIGAMAGPAIARGASFLQDHEGKPVFDTGITIIDEPLRPQGLASHPFDGEGLPTAPTTLIADGVLTGWLLDAASARKLGRRPTGHAVRSGGAAPSVSTSNVVLQAGAESVSDLIADIADGVYITDLIGQGVNGVTGDYSRGASGFRIVGGEIAGPVSGITIAGNLLQMFAHLRPANDLEMTHAVNVPTLRVDGMTVAGC
ncbi:TldD/PmbA family protein [Croceicoccus naphthovorans]|uniref:Modulator protein n=1 Tax=Croceicoccus naphthovorans TaxID=1348774 RepID=A0A0G3XEH3_9SPHN|nr:TldD/PmbA family protein [Croceicoccus naphthovorans]AKM08773.1 modulator protein [Croceicoccus naphthovorans]MBB3992104.1 PmbA protein [Croceicoccus naphthovorans]